MSLVCNQIGTFTNKIWNKALRTKSSSPSGDLMNTQLRRCLSTFDIILLGIGHMVGSGAYVLTSSVAKNIAGPAIVLSYIISGFAAFLCALCYAEFSRRFPKCGSAYSYTYIALGEIWAFIVGWNMILENVIGIAAISRACSAYLDATIGGELHNYTISLANPIFGENVTSHMDIFAGIIAIGFAVFLTSGMEVTTCINNVFSIINIVAIFLIIVIGAYFSDLDNWRNPPGGFMPYGWSGVFAGSASCFYAYIGFDSIATSGEEAKDPQKSIPIATFVSMIIATISYVGVSVVMTLMIPYNEISEESGLPDALGFHGAMWAKFAVIIGACCGMATVLIGTIYSLTRIVYAMADDGLLFPWMSYINITTQIPLMAMFFFTSFGVVLAIFIDITTLIEMMSIGTLIAYLVVSASTIVIRYQKTIELAPEEPDSKEECDDMIDNDDNEQEKLLPTSESQSHWLQNAYKAMINKEAILTNLTNYFHDSLISIAVFCIVVLTACFCLTCKLFNKGIDDKLIAFLLSLIGTLLIIIISIVNMHDQNVTNLRYKVPLVPFIPVLSIFFNISLIINLNWLTWMRFIIWMIIGFSIYFLYGIKHSKAPYCPQMSEPINNKNETKSWGSIDSTNRTDDNFEVSTE